MNPEEHPYPQYQQLEEECAGATQGNMSLMEFRALDAETQQGLCALAQLNKKPRSVTLEINGSSVDVTVDGATPKRIREQSLGDLLDGALG